MFIHRGETDLPEPNEGVALISERYTRDDNVRSREYPYPWDTTTLTPHNGIYRVTVRAWAYTNLSGGQTHEISQARNLIVDNPPKTPAAPRIVSKTGTTVSVEWDKAPEPDVLSYRLFRAKSSKADKVPALAEFKEVASVATTSVRDEVKDDGFYWYTLIVSRRSVENSENKGMISSAPSPISKAAEVKPAPDDDDDGDAPGAAAPAFQPRVVSRLPRLTTGSAGLRPPPVPDAPFSAILPYDLPEGADEIPEEDPGVTDPRGPVLPVAVGAFLVSSALALGRMPY